MRDLINKLTLLESREVNILKLSQGFKKDKEINSATWRYLVKLELEKDDLQYGGTVAELLTGTIIINFHVSKETGQLINRMPGKLAFHDAPYRDFDEVWIDYQSSIEENMQDIMGDQGLSDSLCQEIDLKGTEMPIGIARFAITPNLLLAFNDAYQWRQENVGDL